MDRVVIGSVVQVHILKQYHRYSSLLPATVTAATALPTIEATTAATIGHRDRSTATPATSASTVAMYTCSTTSVRTVILSVASRNNKSLR